MRGLHFANKGGVGAISISGALARRLVVEAERLNIPANRIVEVVTARALGIALDDLPARIRRAAEQLDAARANTTEART